MLRIRERWRGWKGSVSELLATILLLTAIRQLVSGDLLGAVPGVPRWFAVTVSILELIGAAELAIPRFRILGGIWVFVLMISVAIFVLLGADISLPANRVLLVAGHVAIALWGFLAAWQVGGRHRGTRSLFRSAQEQLLVQVKSVVRRGA